MCRAWRRPPHRRDYSFAHTATHLGTPAALLHRTLHAGGTYCDWHGIVCDFRRLHVVELYLDSNKLDGHIPYFDGLYWLRSM